MSRHCLGILARPVALSRSCSHVCPRSATASASSSRQLITRTSSSPAHRPRRSTLSAQRRCYATPTLKFKQSVITVEEYQRLSDRVFDSLTDYLEEVVEDYDGPDADEVEVEYYMGVLNLRLAEHGTYVINKQPANKQIWFSSPTSGPKRFDYDKAQNAWFMLKDGEEWNLRDLLNRELSQIFGKEIKVNLGER